jgi:hypothetical protein
MEIVGKDGLGNFLGHPETESVGASASGEVDCPEFFAAGVDLDDSLSATDVEEFVDKPYGLEDLKRARMNQRGTVPVVWAGVGIDQMARDAAALELGSEEKTCGACADYEDRGSVSCRRGVHCVEIGDMGFAVCVDCRRLEEAGQGWRFGVT